MNRSKPYRLIAAGLMAVSFLAGCGGDGDPVDDSIAPALPDQGALPTTATASSPALVAYLQSLSPTDEQAVPNDVINPASLDDETSQPIDI